MADRIEFHDSELLAIEASGRLLFNAYVHRKVGDRGEGGMQMVRLWLGEGSVFGPVEPLPAIIYDAELTLDGIEYKDLLPLSTRIDAAVRLTLTLSDDARQVTCEGKASG